MMLGGASSCAHAPAAKSGPATHEGGRREAGAQDFAGLLGAASGTSTAAETASKPASKPEATQQDSTAAPRDKAEPRRRPEAPATADAGVDAQVDEEADPDADSASTGEGAATESEAPPLPNWLFGLMAATGNRGVPADPVDAAAAESSPTSDPVVARLAVARGNAERPSQSEASPPLFAQSAELSAALADSADSAAVSTAVPESGADFGADMVAAMGDASSRPPPQLANALAVGVSELRREAPVAAPASALVADGALSMLSPEFIPDLGEHIVWQMDQGVSEAKIELHPAELGALTVRIETRGDQASVHIVAAEAATRAMLSQALPQLRELLGGSGLQLARSQIESGGRRDERSGERGSAPQSEPGPRRRISRVVLVDAYV